ncbi:hypothetical protein SteCoe_24179 [Stentor coeruleus]|uniref:START domain-containing protein n=1 Tax=Stentor coeruleus TaxID=5963 RepID=A0A1R2BI57_9CILI|nr:hypothetical protein SteCoe_24179 [Stentor coeruleus]
MGCCSSRDEGNKEISNTEKFSNEIYKKVEKTLTPSDLDSSKVELQKSLTPSLSLLLQEASSLNIKPLSDFHDSHAEYILSYSESIKTWQLVKSVDWMSIEKIDESEFNKDYPMAHTMKFKSYIPLKLLIEQLNSCEQRPQWDTHVSSMEIIKGDIFSEYYLYRTMKILLFSADFVDKKIVAIYGDAVVIIGYAAQGIREPIKGTTRSSTILSIHKITIENGVTVMNNYSQTDANSLMAKAVAKLGPAKLIEWGRALVKRIESLNTITQ